MPALLTSTTIVAVAEIGDKTQLLSLLLAARYRRPAPIIAAILLATVANHALAAWLGATVAAGIDPQWLRWLLGASFLAIGLWALCPDKLDGGPPPGAKLGVFAAYAGLALACGAVPAEDLRWLGARLQALRPSAAGGVRP